ncbi:hypothetical protein WCQ02_24630 [Paraburkholderia tropica]|uniref:hypothetical protein n=1 Tax=Paraburkholderia tropica TaxID=92647 RepID=UPI003019C429
MQTPYNDNLDPDFYRAFYPDLANMSVDQAKSHYHDHGLREGRYPNQTAYLANMGDVVSADEPILPPDDVPETETETLQEAGDHPVRHHLLLGGTGRAGTSFMVQYLTACGLDTHSSRHPDEQLEEHANAGLEDLPIGDGANLPYLIKTPWLYEFIDRLIAQEDVVIDAVIITMRDIVEAATSRVMLEMRGRLGNDALVEEHTRWETWGTTPGGLVYSLNPVDQARILALGFYQVIHALVKHDIPVVFLDFPRFIEDGNYLYDQLKSVLGDGVSRETALAAHRALARVDLVRVGAELGSTATGQNQVAAPIGFPSHETIDRTTLFRELKRAKSAAESAKNRSCALEAAARRDREMNVALKNEILSLTAKLDAQRKLVESVQHDREKDAEIQRRIVDDLSDRLGASNDQLVMVERSFLWRAAAAGRRLLGRK